MALITKLNYLNIAPRKVRLVADLIRGKKVKEAQTILDFTSKKAASPFLKLLKSAVSNAKNTLNIEESNLYISKITVDEGPKLKRWMPRARGSPSEIHKKTSHITLVVEEIKSKKEIIKGKEKISREIPRVAEKVKKTSKPRIMKREKKFEKPKITKAVKRIFSRKAI